MRRQISKYLEDLKQFRQIRPGNAKDIQQFADLLDLAIINLKKAGQHFKLGNGSLYAKLQRKLPEAMLALYHFWVFENSYSECVITLSIWVIQKSEFLTIASETVRGLRSKQSVGVSASTTVGNKSQRTFFRGGGGTRATTRNWHRHVRCAQGNTVYGNVKTIQMNVSDSWTIARQCQLCYRCLANGHHGEACPIGRQCGQNGCRELHHRLLHKSDVLKSQSKSPGETEVKRTYGNDEHLATGPSIPAKASSVTEGNGQQGQTTMDCAELYCALEEVRGNPGEPLARLTPLGLTCIGNPGSKSRHLLQTNFACTYFARNQLGIEKLNDTLKRFWENDDVSTPKETPVMSIEERSAMRTVEKSITYENSMHRVGIPWRADRPTLPNS